MPEHQRPVAVVTGASRGIGRAIAVELAKSHMVVGTYRSQEDEARKLHEETGAHIVRCDLSSSADRQQLVQYVREKFGRIDILVNNAGMAPRQRVDLLEASEESFDELIAANLKGPHFLTQQFARMMVERGYGYIVFVTSISAYTASVNRAEYCISKAGLSMSAAVYAARLAAHGVRVFEIRPGIIRTDMIKPVEATYEERIRSGLLPIPRMGEPSDVARAVRAIVDGYFDYSTGLVLDVDGGFHLRIL